MQNLGRVPPCTCPGRPRPQAATAARALAGVLVLALVLALVLLEVGPALAGRRRPPQSQAKW